MVPFKYEYRKCNENICRLEKKSLGGIREWYENKKMTTRDKERDERE